MDGIVPTNWVGQELRLFDHIANHTESIATIDLHGGSHMKLNHLNLTLSNVPETHSFIETHFALKGHGGRDPGKR
jgi:hypothetical protein